MRSVSLGMREQRECVAVELPTWNTLWTHPYDHMVLVRVSLSLVALEAVHSGADGVPLGGETYLGHKRRCPTQR